MTSKLSEKELIAAKLLVSLGGTINKESTARLVWHIDALDDEIKQHIANIDRLQDNIIQLTSELKEEREGKKVVLPKAVADDIEKLLIVHEGRFFSVVDAFLDGHITCASREWRDTRPDSNELIKALVNGYTIEEPPTTEDKLRTELTPKIEEWLKTSSTFGVIEGTKELLDLIMPVTRRVIQAVELEEA